MNIFGESAGDLSGFRNALSSDGNSVIIGAINNDGNGSNSGHARVYTYQSCPFPGVDFLCKDISNVNALYVGNVYGKSSSINFHDTINLTDTF